MNTLVNTGADHVANGPADAAADAPPALAFYLYYKVMSEQAPLLVPRVRQMQENLRRCADAGVLASSLHQRLEATSTPLQTWMEIYRCQPSAQQPHPFLHHLQQATLEADILAFIQGERHLECFMELESCA
ncbi:MAG: DUF4936 family protein [Burkholderiales bacterium]|nr:DUF4936 family protein [Burkholderiales bacterium]